MLQELRRTLMLLDRASRRRLVGSTPVSVFLAIYEAFGVYLILPFSQALVQPDTYSSSGISGRVYDFLGAQSNAQYFMRLGAIIVVVFLTRSVASIFFYRWQYDVVMGTEGTMASRLFAHYMTQDYSTFLSRNSAVLVRNLHYGVETFITSVVLSYLYIANEAVLVLAIGITLLVVQPAATVFAILVLVVSSVVYMSFVSPISRNIGSRLLGHYETAQQWMQESFASYKSISVTGSSQYFADRFSENRTSWGKERGAQVFVMQMPKYFLELVVIVLVCGTTIVVMSLEPTTTAVATLAVFVAGVLRLLPSLLRILSSVSQIRLGGPSIEMLTEEFQGEEQRRPKPPPAQRLELDGRVSFRQVGYTHKGSGHAALTAISTEIRRGETVGIVGRSGAGKTTFVDLLLGLYQPDEGEILVDGTALDGSTIPTWQVGVGYVPQEVVLFDGDLKSNIAFGVEADLVDDAQVDRALAGAQLEEWATSLPRGLDSLVGERGTTISGGQRQRIGVARALYRDPQLLVLDEATASLDGETEAALLSTIQGLAGRCTVVVVAHRLKTVRPCDRIFFFDAGRLVDVGPFDELIQRQPDFARLAQLADLETVAGSAGT